MIRKLIFFFIVFCIASSVNAQLSDLHYLPPLKQGRNNLGIRQQAIYLSTPEPVTFTVNAYQGTNPTPVASFNISNVSPAVYTLANGDNNITLVTNANTGVVLTNSGLRFESPSGNKFYVNYRGSSSAQSASLTSKGRVAMGTRFKWGGVPNLGQHVSKSNTLGIMATEDNTTIDVFGYDPACEFRQGNNVGGITADTYQIILDANESFVFEAYVGTSPIPANRAGWIGASVVSDKNIVISNGAMNFGRQVNQGNRDAGIDQPVPENQIGKEYVFVRGNGNVNGWTEFPLLIATADNTEIFVNGSPTPIATLNNGDYFEVPSNLYSSNVVGANMHVLSSKNIYAYQCLAGASQVYTQGLNFVAPVNCLLPDVMDNIPDIRNMAGTLVNGGVTIIAAVNTPDSNIIVNDSNGLVTLPASKAVAGSADWKTFYIPNLTGNVSVQSTGPMAVGFFGANGARGVAGYFSGFDTVPQVDLDIVGGTGCFVGSTIVEATGNFDAYQWYHDGAIVPGANSATYAPSIAGDYFVRGTKGPCTYDSKTIAALYCDPDVVVNKTVDKPEIMEGESVTFTIRVRNLGVGPLTNLQITDNIPSGLSFVSAFTLEGSWSGNTWNIGTLNGGETAVLELEVQADEIDTLPLLSLTNTASNSQDQTDTNTTTDNPSARVVVHNDYDNDGVKDIEDVDDDNDGVYDEQECSTLSFNITGGNPHNSPLISVEDYLILDIFSLDNSFNLQINGTDLAGEIQFQAAPGNFARFFDGFGYGENGIPQIYTITGSPGSPLLRVVVDQNGAFELFGARSSNGPLEPMTLTTPPVTFAWNPSGNNNISINQAVTGPTNMSGVLLTAGCDTDGDGKPDQLDLDSDDDGCSDANEFYKDESADGNDGGEYGIGVPIVDANDGSVNAASYIKVFAPELLLENTSEDLAGNDINGQSLSLGQTFEYVLRFQNTGDDDATNYTIRDILPDNLTLDNIDISDAPGTTHTYDINTKIINFTIPDNLVEIGDPEYSIRIRVTLASSCTEFVDACSSQLRNLAFSTYQGVVNNTVFTDEGGSLLIGCPRTPEVAENSILNDLANCDEARIVQLCGDDVILSAGIGFTNYKWVLDTNANNVLDASDTVMNDGDPDSDPSTLRVTDIGTYIVEKSSTASCPDLVEIMKVERFGTTQTNPIVTYFNQVNADANPDNDLQGEIVTCSIDGDILPNIFLCGSTDEALIELGITDADSIVWQKLDVGSCSAAPADCANKNGTCSWDEVATSTNHTLTEEGEYRVVINYMNGCFSRFYFNVFKNELDIINTSNDILCATPGSIRITNVGSGYGFQLLNAVDNSILIPFSANNGPNFDITASGTYKVQITQLNPADNTPIVGSCIFETNDIGIQEKDFSVNLTSEPADCNQLGSISVAALNALPNYSYELRLDDGSNGGAGALVSTQIALTGNTYTFLNVNPEDYIVITRTQDGCFDSQQITVAEIPELSLGAVSSENITCTPGIVNLTPTGGLPSPDYEMALWSKDGTALYANESSVPDGDYQTITSFLFGEAGNPHREGDYSFILRDGNGCYAISNTVRIEDLGDLSISATDSGIICADSATAIMTISVTGGTAPYTYSLDGGTTYQTTNTFSNLAAGLYTITVKDSSGSTGTGCVQNFEYEIAQPFRLSASATIIEDASCNPLGALVKIINPSGGIAPYEYSINGSAFSGVQQANLLPGDHDFIVKDALGCTFEMELAVPNSTVEPSFSNDVTYACNGEGIITITPSNTTDFTYTYSLNGTVNTPSDNNVFSNVTDGSHNVSIGYTGVLGSNQSTLFYENFGAGPTTQIAEIGPDYCYEPQDGSIISCNRGPAGILVNGEYTVTNFVTNPIPSLTSPVDHTGLTDGRFLAIDISTFSDTGAEKLNTILWEKRNIEVLADQEVSINFWAYNLMNNTGTGNNPEVTVAVYDTSGVLIYSENTAEIPKNTNSTDWHERVVTFDPGLNTEVDIVFRSNVNSNDGNDLILDDILASQQPKVCEKFKDFTVNVEDNKEFTAALLGTTNPSCNGSSDGSIRFEVLNYDVATGFEYSTDSGTTWATSLASPITTSATLADGTYNVIIRKISDISCSADFDATLTQPSPLVPQLNQIAAFTCFNTGGTLEASAIGGSPAYQYQLEDTTGGIIVAYQTSTQFVNITDGDYLVRVRDQNLCEVVSTTAVTVTPPAGVVFDLTPTSCYSGSNDGSILVNVTAGNGNYEFRLNSGAWVTPTPANATSHTFTNLSNGSYNIEVRDQLGCPATANTQTAVIHPQLVASVDVVALSSCADGSITVNAIGGNGTLRYAIVPANTSPTGLYTVINTLTVTEAMALANPGGYDVYVVDNNNAPALCAFVQEDIIFTPVAPLTVNAVPTDPECFNGLGSIDITVSGGTSSYTYELVDLAPADGIDYSRSSAGIFDANLVYNGIGVGNYEVTITDVALCTVTSSTITISNATEITADIIPILPVLCDDPDPLEYGFEFDNVVTPAGTVEYSADGGATWQASNELRGYSSGTAVFPSIRVIKGSSTVCQKDFDRYLIPFPLDDLDITLSAVIVGCNDLRVTVEGSEGNPIPGYEYTYTDDPANFNTFAINPAVWTAPLASGTAHTFQNIDPSTPQYPGIPLLVPGRTYVFYVRDGSGCIRQSNVNVNEIPGIGLPLEVTTDITPTCDGAATGSLTFNLNPTTAHPNMRWEIYELGNTIPIEVSGGGATAVNVPYSAVVTTTIPLDEGEYYISIIQVDASNVDACRGASENVYLPELAPISATAVATRDISCNLPGLIAINSISGGGGAPYTYDVSGPSGFTTLSGAADNPVQVPVNSPAGNYTVTLYDQYSCPLVLNTVALGLSPNPTLSVAQDNCTAPIRVTAVGNSAAGNLRYAMVTTGNPAPTSYEDNGGVFDNVLPGSYDVYVVDGNGCINLQTAFEVHPVLSASASLTKLLDCTMSPEANITMDIVDGSGNYEYSISNTSGAPAVTQTAVPGTNFTYQAPSAGDYTITIYDTNSPNTAACNREFTITVPARIEPIIDPAIATTNVTCVGDNDGTITIATSNNKAAPYTFEITSFDGTAASILPTTSSGNIATFTGLAPTTTTLGYVITVTGDASTNNCSVESTSIVISEPAVVSFAVPTVNPFSCSTGNAMDNAVISINTTSIAGGSGTYVRYEFIDVATGDTLQDGTNSDYIYTNLSGGDVRVIVYDDNGCPGEVVVNVPEFDILGVPVVTIDNAISCSGLVENISIDIASSVTNYTANPANYEFRMLPSATFQASNQFTNLAVGSYTFGVRNISTGCEVTVDHTVVNPNTFDVTVEKLADVVCFGDNGSIRLLMADATYSSSFSWSIFDTNGTPADRSDDGAAVATGNSPNFGPTAAINVPAGNYLVEVTQDAFPSCSQLRSFNIITPSAPLSLAPVVLEDVGCSNDRGSANIIPLGGQAPYDITLTNNTTSVSATVNQIHTNIFQGLTAGQYNVTVTDALGCTDTFVNVFELVLPDPISGVISATDLECQGDSDASIAISLATRNVTTNYRFVLNTYNDITGSILLQSTAVQILPTFDNQSAGFYSISVTDDMGCSFESNVIAIVDPTETNAMLVTKRSLSCLVDAELELTASGGTAPYMWSIDGVNFSPMNEMNSANTHAFQNLTAGMYQYFIKDSFNCVSMVSNEIVISPIEDLTIAVDTTAAVVNCNGESTAIIVANASGGLGNYQYGLYSDIGLNNVVRPYQNSGTFADLPAGNYYISVQSEDCQRTSAEILIAEPDALVVNEQVTNISCKGADDGAVVINVTGGSGTYQYAISPNLNQFDNENSFENLAVGDYTVITQDNKGCFELVEFSITEPEALAMTLSATPEVCEGDSDGTITVDITGGTAPYSTAINSENDADFVEGRLLMENLEGGDYFIYVRDANGCDVNDFIKVENGANLNATVEVVYECDGDSPSNRLHVVFEDDTVADDVLYALDSSNAADFVLDPNFENMNSGNHFLTVAHANGCLKEIEFTVEAFDPLVLSLEQLGLNEITANVVGGKPGYTYYFDEIDNGIDNTFYIKRTDTYTVRVVDENGCVSSASIFMEFIDIEIPNFFTPDGDGQNDVWIPRNISQFPDIFITIFDRYGREVYQIKDDKEGWNGLYQEANLPTGDYWYIIKLNGEDDDREFVGNFTLYR